MALRILFEGSVPKHIDSPNDNEDAYLTQPERGRVVLADGASESFDARNWARLLVEHAAVHDLSTSDIEACAQDYASLHDPSQLSWSRAAAFERGSFSTLLVAQDEPERNTIVVHAVGDSLAVWCDGSTVLDTTPYDSADAFRQRPTLLSTKAAMNAWAIEGPMGRRVEWRYEADGYRLLLCMTDALGAWLLRHEDAGDPTALERLVRIRESNELLKLVESERSLGLVRDDTTLVIALLTQDA